VIPRRLIVPVTFAEDTEEAVAVAAAYAAALDAELVMVGIAPVAPLDAPLEVQDAGGVARQTQRQELLNRMIAERLEDLSAVLPAVRLRTVQSYGPVGVALVAAAAQERADLVVVPIRRERALPHLVHDYADRYVLHHSDVPVLVVPTNAPYATLNGDHG
jgi:nucleotide-binding universal stress UspA family protein